MDYKRLKTYVDSGLSIRAIAKQANKSPSSIRYWLKKYELKTTRNKEIPLCKWCQEPIKNYRSPKKFCDAICSENNQREKNNKRVLKGIAGQRAAKTYLLRESKGCACCGISEWCGKEIVLEIDHIDGNFQNNALNNLRLLCPNCHSQTETYKGKNKGNGRYKRRQRYSKGLSY